MKLKILNLQKNIYNPLDGMPSEFFASNGCKGIDDGNLDTNSDDLKIPAVITLDNCDIKPVSCFIYSPEN